MNCTKNGKPTVHQFEVNRIPRDDLYLIKERASIFAIDDCLRMSENVIVLFYPEKINIKFLPHEKGIELFRFEIFKKGKGIGTELMNLFIAVSKQLNIKIYLNPSHPVFRKRSDEKILRRFYLSCGFNPIPGSIYWRN